jgi:hypothetical protein
MSHDGPIAAIAIYKRRFPNLTRSGDQGKETASGLLVAQLWSW